MTFEIYPALRLTVALQTPFFFALPNFRRSADSLF
jgi:hypothetical protein